MKKKIKRENLIIPEAMCYFVQSGNAIFWLNNNCCNPINDNLEDTFKYKIEKAKHERIDDMYRVYLYVDDGVDMYNRQCGHYRYIGLWFYNSDSFVIEHRYKNCTRHYWPKPHRLIANLLCNIDDTNITRGYNMYHCNICAVCGRELTKTSVEYIGPVCFKKLHR